MVIDMDYDIKLYGRLDISRYSNRWYVAYLKPKDFGRYSRYKPNRFKGCINTLVRGGPIARWKTDREMSKFREHKGKVQIRLG